MNSASPNADDGFRQYKDRSFGLEEEVRMYTSDGSSPEDEEEELWLEVLSPSDDDEECPTSKDKERLLEFCSPFEE